MVKSPAIYRGLFAMSSFTVRVELHGASGAQYDALHDAMERNGFYRAIEGVGGDGVSWVYAMPTAEYDHVSQATCVAVRDAALRIASSVKSTPEPWVFVTEANNRAWTSKIIRSAQQAA